VIPHTRTTTTLCGEALEVGSASRRAPLLSLGPLRGRGEIVPGERWVTAQILLELTS
jgi:hypothetical protein